MAANSISVAIRVRPLSSREQGQLAVVDSSTPFSGDGSLCAPIASSSTSNGLSGSRSPTSMIRRVVKVLDDRVCVFDPPETSPIASYQKTLLGPSVKKVKDIRFCFDKVFDETAGQEDVFEGCAKELVPGVLDGFNATVFAYGATGCGKTHTISGSPTQPGIVFLLMKDLFDRISAKQDEMTVEVSISYLEIYNETIRDLLMPDGPHKLDLREAEGRVTVPGLSEQSPKSAEEVVQMIISANVNRTVNATEANAVSSRSHAVLSVNVKQKPRTAAMTEDYTMATLSVIDLAGSERASVTKNKGERLIEGANINKSLLALGSCINALCDAKKSNHVPFRNSKLTRLLKHSLGGNCRTVMIVCVSPSSHHYDETFNTLQYANRAKEIKTKVTRNVVSVDRHVSQYVRVIYELRQELELRKSGDKDVEKRIRDETRAASAKAGVELKEVLEKLRKTYLENKEKLVSPYALREQLANVQQAQSALTEWKSRVFPASEAFSPSYVYTIDNLLSTYNSQTRNLSSLIAQAETAKSTFDTACSTITRKIMNPLGSIATMHPEYLQLVQKEQKIIELEMALAGANARDQARQRNTQLITDLQSTLEEIRAKVEVDNRAQIGISAQQNPVLEELLQRMDNASKAILTTFGPAASQRREAGPSVTSSAASKKRSTATRSPLFPSSNTSNAGSSSSFNRPSKAPRPSLAVTSASGSASPARTRRSPRKVSTGARVAPRPSLKPSSLLRKTSTSSLNGSTAPTTTTRKEEQKGVVWKDDTGDALTEEHTKSIIDYSDTSGDISGSVPGSSAKTTLQPTRAGRILPENSIARKSGAKTLPQQGQSTIMEEDESLVSTEISNDSMASSAADSSFGSDGTAVASAPKVRSGLAFKARSSIAPSSMTSPRRGLASRRISSIGPIRSAKQTRRASYIDPSNGNLVASDSPAGAAAMRSPGAARRASRTTLSFQNKLAANAAAASNSSHIQEATKGLTGVNARVAAARARRQSAAAYASNAPARSLDISLDLSNAAGRPPIWR